MEDLELEYDEDEYYYESEPEYFVGIEINPEYDCFVPKYVTLDPVLSFNPKHVKLDPVLNAVTPKSVKLDLMLTGY